MAACLPRLFAAALSVARSPGEGATAQFRRGILAESTEIMLFPAVPPALLLPAGTFQVDVKNQSTGPARLLVTTGRGDHQADGGERQPAAIRRGQARHDGCRDAHRMDAHATQRHEIRVGDAAGGHQAGHRQERQDAHRADLRVRPQQADRDRRGRRRPCALEVRRGTQVLADETARFTYQRRSPRRGRRAARRPKSKRRCWIARRNEPPDW